MAQVLVALHRTEDPPGFGLAHRWLLRPLGSTLAGGRSESLLSLPLKQNVVKMQFLFQYELTAISQHSVFHLSLH